jgi:hypothetical protein
VVVPFLDHNASEVLIPLLFFSGIDSLVRTMADPISILRARRAKILAEAQRELEAIDNDLRELERLTTVVHKYGLEVVDKATTVPRNLDDEFGDELLKIVYGPEIVHGPTYKAAISVSEQTIRAANQPLELDELYDACVDKGVKLGGERPRSTLSAYLSHSASTVRSIRKGTYWLKDLPVPS